MKKNYIIGIFMFLSFAYLQIAYFLPSWKRFDKKYYSNSAIKYESNFSTSDKQFEPQKDWQPVTGSTKDFQVYAAYSIITNKVNPEILIIGVTKPYIKDQIQCEYYFPRNISSEKTNLLPIPGTIETIMQGYTKALAPTFLRCPVPPSLGNTKPEMVSVSILGTNKTKPSNMMKIQYTDKGNASSYLYNFTVCVKATYNFDKAFDLLEWMEFYKIMGVEHFAFYNITFSEKTSCILNDLIEGGDPSIKVDVYPWNIFPNTGKARRNAQYSVGANEQVCAYSHRGISRYVIFVDFDEFIWPKEDKAKSLQELIDLLDSQNPEKKFGEYNFQNGFFVLSRPDDPNLLDRCQGYPEKSLMYKTCQKSVMIKKVVREKDFPPYRRRSKYIMRPEGVKIASNHYVVSFEPGYEVLKVPLEFGYHRHYRNFAGGNDTVEDKVSEGFASKLVYGLAKNLEYYEKVCNVTI